MYMPGFIQSCFGENMDKISGNVPTRFDDYMVPDSAIRKPKGTNDKMSKHTGEHRSQNSLLYIPLLQSFRHRYLGFFVLAT